jgi:hypothetical protein
LREGAGIVTLNQLSTDLGERVGSQLQRVMASVPVTQHQKVEEFLGSAEYKAIMRHLCALRLRHGPEYKEIAQQSISMMASGMRLYLISDKMARGLSQQLLDVTIKVVDEAFEARPKQLKKHLSDPIFAEYLSRQEETVHRTIEALIHTGETSKAIAWLDRYRKAALERYGRIRAPHWDAQVVVNLERVYVPARFRFISEIDAHDQRRAEIVEARAAAFKRSIASYSDSERQRLKVVFQRTEADRDPSELIYREFALDRTVVLGDPGAGKTTLSSRIAFDVLAGKTFINSAEFSPSIPFIITTREFADPTRRLSFVDHIEGMAADSLQAKPPDGFVEFLLLSGRAMVVFDGLDEILNTSRRRELASAIDSFCHLYSNAAVVVTAREVGYDLAPLDPALFTILRIQPFAQDDVKRYAHSWFVLDESIPSVVDRRGAAENFLQSSESVSDLRSNPLLLALLCNLFKATGYQDLPRSRPAVLEKCALVLFDRWDRHRGIGDIDFERDFQPIVAYIAHVMFTDARFAEGIRESQLLELAVAFLWPARFASEDAARSFARSFVDHCTGRAWVFSDVGHAADGETIYLFSHRTFLEYFAAVYVVRSFRTVEAIFGIIGTHILAADWGLVPLLIVQILNRQFDDAADDIVVSVLALIADEPERQWIARSFLADVQAHIPLGAVARQMLAEALENSASPHSQPDNGPPVWIRIQDSTLIAAACYVSDQREIRVRLRSGERRRYIDCSPEMWTDFITPGHSKGQFLTHILERHRAP